jgi:hypothetical protein
MMDGDDIFIAGAIILLVLAFFALGLWILRIGTGM